jgi:hypothetical protein
MAGSRREHVSQLSFQSIKTLTQMHTSSRLQTNQVISPVQWLLLKGTSSTMMSGTVNQLLLKGHAICNTTSSIQRDVNLPRIHLNLWNHILPSDKGARK